MARYSCAGAIWGVLEGNGTYGEKGRWYLYDEEYPEEGSTEHNSEQAAVDYLASEQQEPTRKLSKEDSTFQQRDPVSA